METYRHAVGLCERVLALTATTLSDLVLVVSVVVENEGASLDPGGRVASLAHVHLYGRMSL